jgi:hypothetical protein
MGAGPTVKPRLTAYGDGDPCPMDPNHGRMWLTKHRNQWCPHIAHPGTALYEYDGVTPVVSRPALDPPPRRRAASA